MSKNSGLYVFISIVLFMAVILSCSKKTPTVPAETAPTATFTATYTATNTGTNTPTATPVTIADFEESSCITSIICSNCTNQVLGAVTTGIDLYAKNCITLSSQPAEYGTKAYSVSATAQNDNNKWFAAYPQTRSVNGVGSDFSAYNRLNFSYKVNTDAVLADKIKLNISLIDATIAHRLEISGIELDRTGNWASLSLDPYTFTNTSTTLTTPQILAIVEQVRFYISVEGDGLSTPFVEFIFDNVTMSRQ
ncbi:MAG: hypothetical protein CVV21_11235 [Candidatus Goldiibacteriota bacterium HGW-Goldbacteria-1]|jgi:hypothetical protein|nr:MAG: hypothetical protein CVV21_11235 [Candidatus Goldiibacteriota bacterium HGW-Goldbacteria-1]